MPNAPKELLLVGGAVNGRPFVDDFNVTGTGVGEVGIQDEAEIDAEVEGSFVLKIDGDGVVFAGGEQLDFFDCPAFHFSELHKLAVRELTFN